MLDRSLIEILFQQKQLNILPSSTSWIITATAEERETTEEETVSLISISSVLVCMFMCVIHVY